MNGERFNPMEEEYKKGTSDNPKFGPSKEGYIPVENLESTSPSPEDILLEKEDGGYEELREGEDVLKIAEPPVAESGDFGVVAELPAEEILEVDEFVPESEKAVKAGDRQERTEKMTKEEKTKLLLGKERARQPRRKGKK